MSDLPLTPDTTKRRIPRWVKWAVGLAIAGLALLYGSILVYINFIKEEAPPAFSEESLGDRLGTTTTTGTGTAATSAVATTAPAASTAPTATVAATAPAASAAPTTAAGGASSWVATDASEVGYRVQEVLFGVETTAVGRTNAVTGSLTIEGTQVTTTEFTVDVATITSPESKRDEQFRGRIMSTDEFPTATFVLTQPIELGVEPAEGVQVTVPATGELTLRGVTQPVTFDVTALLQNGLIGVQGAIPVVFADYSIENPSVSGITTEDNGLVEFILVFTPA